VSHLKANDILTRIGGDEFVIILKDPNESISIAENIIKDFENAIVVKDYDLHITTSLELAYSHKMD
jgi:GGDEF domain-containing protein